MYPYNPKYSLLIYKSEMTDSVIPMITYYLKQGVKVYFLTLDPVDSLLENSFMKQAYKKDLLRVYELMYKEEFASSDHIFVDGVVTNDELIGYFNECSSFNRAQYEIEHEMSEAHSIIKAGAGTGKTTVMLDRLLAMKHMQPTFSFKELVMITFTNESALHMKKKLMDRLYYYYEITSNPKYLSWVEELSEVIVGTIHSFAKTFLASEGALIGLLSSLSVRTYKHEKRRLVERGIDEFAREHPEIYQGFKYIPQYEIVQSILAIIETLSNKALSELEVSKLTYGEEVSNTHVLIKSVISHVQSELAVVKRKDQALEMNDLISELKKLTDQMLEKPKKMISYVMIDEFQDSDEAQVTFISWLVELYQCRLFAVGDVKQSIYRFRGADYTAFDQLKEKLANSHLPYVEKPLLKNYRSTKSLLEDFDKLFKSWARNVELFSYSEDDCLLSTVESDEEESFVPFQMNPTDMKHLLQRLYEKDVAVLVRSNRQVDKAVNEIEAHGFFCDAKRSGMFYRSTAVREFYLLVRRFTHPNVWSDRYALHKSSYGENKLSVSNFIKDFTDEKIYQAKLLEPYDRFDEEISLMNHQPALLVLEKLIQNLKPSDVYRRRFYTKMRLSHPDQSEEMQKEEALMKMKEYKMNLEHLIFLIKKEFTETTATLSQIERFLRIKMSTDTEETEFHISSDSHRIAVMTVHQAKGQEFDYVILPYTDSTFLQGSQTRTILLNQRGQWSLGYKVTWKDQSFSNSFMEDYTHDDNKEIVAEETRLLYVALTRAKKAVYANSVSDLTHVRTISRWSQLLKKGSEQHVSS